MGYMNNLYVLYTHTHTHTHMRVYATGLLLRNVYLELKDTLKLGDYRKCFLPFMTTLDTFICITGQGQKLLRRNPEALYQQHISWQCFQRSTVVKVKKNLHFFGGMKTESVMGHRDNTATSQNLLLIKKMHVGNVTDI